MATITFGGVGSGLDTESIVTGLVKASQGPLNQIKAQAVGLTGASLVTVAGDRVIMLDTIREIAGDLLVEFGAADRVRTAHARYLLDLVTRLGSTPWRPRELGPPRAEPNYAQ